MKSRLSQHPTLLILPSIHAAKATDGRLIMPRKFIEGVAEYSRHWPGRVSVLARTEKGQGINLDEAPIEVASLSFNLAVQDGGEVPNALRDATVVLATLIEPYLPLAGTCRQLNVPLVYIAENSVRTRRQQIAADAPNLPVRLRRQWYTTRMERRYRAALRVAPGVQCNGTPTFGDYRDLTPSPLLYFDTRAAENMLIASDALETRLAHLMRGGPLRLAWSGRFLPIKGPDHLIDVAAQLRNLGVAFTLDLCGDGPLRDQMQRSINQHGLGEHVKFRGVLDFARELMPFMANHVDLFVCCHRQGDPSCTYMETLTCGTPIVGYDNEAWAGLRRTMQAGWTTPMNDPLALAEKIAELARAREQVAAAARAAREFASTRTFERVMKLRIDHLLQCREKLHVGAAGSSMHARRATSISAGAAT
jgi:glycosyltransferase involved in cell wall biosynthesis